MKKSIYLDANDIKEILAEKFKVPETNIVKAQYSYTVILDNDNSEDKGSH